MKRRSDRLAGIMEWLAIGILLMTALAYAQHRPSPAKPPTVTISGATSNTLKLCGTIPSTANLGEGWDKSCGNYERPKLTCPDGYHLEISWAFDVRDLAWTCKGEIEVMKGGATPSSVPVAASTPRSTTPLTDYAQNSLDCVGHGNDGIGLMVKRRSDGKVVSLDFCAGAEDPHYATVKPEPRLPDQRTVVGDIIGALERFHLQLF